MQGVVPRFLCRPMGCSGGCL